MESEKLMPCPFCGQGATLEIDCDEDGDEYVYAECQSCYARTDGSYTILGKRAISDATERWNRRNADDHK